MSFESLLPSSITGPEIRYVVITKTVQVMATKVASNLQPFVTTTVIRYVPVPPLAASLSDQSSTSLDIPHYPRVDTTFTITFGVLCLLLLIGVIFRRSAKKLKGFNIPLILGTFCITSNYCVLIQSTPSATSSTQTTLLSIKNTN
jgi:hypothetical protein